jgi:hypothetical protein
MSKNIRPYNTFRENILNLKKLIVTLPAENGKQLKNIKNIKKKL